MTDDTIKQNDEELDDDRELFFELLAEMRY